MARLSPPKPPGRQEPPPGPNPLFVASVIAVIIAVLAALLAGDSKVVHSNLVYRLIVGGIVFAVIYSVVAILWHAWHRKTLQKFGVGPASGEAPEQPVAKEISARDQDVQEFMETTTDAVEDIDKRLQEQEEKDEDA
jgi:type VI protein secretion system component VasK